MPTGAIAIHCIRASDPGTGYSLFADGFNLAKKLEQAAPRSIQGSLHRPTTFNRRYEDTIVMSRAPIISRDQDAGVVGFRFQVRSMAPLDVEACETDVAFDAISRFDEAHQ